MIFLSGCLTLQNSQKSGGSGSTTPNQPTQTNPVSKEPIHTFPVEPEVFFPPEPVAFQTLSRSIWSGLGGDFTGLGMALRPITGRYEACSLKLVSWSQEVFRHNRTQLLLSPFYVLRADTQKLVGYLGLDPISLQPKGVCYEPIDLPGSFLVTTGIPNESVAGLLNPLPWGNSAKLPDLSKGWKNWSWSQLHPGKPGTLLIRIGIQESPQAQRFKLEKEHFLLKGGQGSIWAQTRVSQWNQVAYHLIPFYLAPSQKGNLSLPPGQYSVSFTLLETGQTCLIPLSHPENAEATSSDHFPSRPFVCEKWSPLPQATTYPDPPLIPKMLPSCRPLLWVAPGSASRFAVNRFLNLFQSLAAPRAWDASHFISDTPLPWDDLEWDTGGVPSPHQELLPVPYYCQDPISDSQERALFVTNGPKMVWGRLKYVSQKPLTVVPVRKNRFDFAIVQAASHPDEKIQWVVLFENDKVLQKWRIDANQQKLLEGGVWLGDTLTRTEDYWLSVVGWSQKFMDEFQYGEGFKQRFLLSKPICIDANLDGVCTAPNLGPTKRNEP